MRLRRRVGAAGGQLEVRVGARHREEDPVVAGVSAEAPDLGQPDPVAVEAHDRVQPVGVARDPELHISPSDLSRKFGLSFPGGWARLTTHAG